MIRYAESIENWTDTYKLCRNYRTESQTNDTLCSINLKFNSILGPLFFLSTKPICLIYSVMTMWRFGFRMSLKRNKCGNIGNILVKPICEERKSHYQHFDSCRRIVIGFFNHRNFMEQDTSQRVVNFWLKLNSIQMQKLHFNWWQKTVNGIRHFIVKS